MKVSKQSNFLKYKEVIKIYIQLKYSPQLIDELKQKQVSYIYICIYIYKLAFVFQAITACLIKKILYSKRLLIDHVEALEQSMLHMQDVTALVKVENEAVLQSKNSLIEFFTARNACILLGSTLLEHFITPKALRFTLLPSLLLSSGFGAMYVVKNVFVFRNKIVERELENLIRTIDEFGNCIRRNMTYFSEVLIMKPQELIE